MRSKLSANIFAFVAFCLVLAPLKFAHSATPTPTALSAATSLGSSTPTSTTSTATSAPQNIDWSVPVKVASIRTPTSGSTQAWTTQQIALAVFEQISNEVIIYLIDRQTGQFRQVVLPNSYIVYSMRFDRNDPNVLWAATSRRAQLFRIDTRTLAFQLVGNFGDDKFIFALGQSNSGKIYVGSFPDARIRQITKNGDNFDIKDLPINADQIGGRTNVKDIVGNETGQVFFHLGSPGRLIGYDEATGRSSPIIDTTDSFLFPLRDFPRAIEAVNSVEDLKPRERLVPDPNDNRPLPGWALNFAPRAQFEAEEKGYDYIIKHDGRTTILPLRARQGGMPIVAFQRVGRNLAIGSTYWNRWFFDFDLTTGRGDAKDIIGRTGEFFTACGDGQRVFIPHYLGLLLEYNPSKPLDPASLIPPGSDPKLVSTDPADNPREVLALPEGHLGLSCAVAGANMYYAMLPNYSQRSGLLGRVANGKLETLVTPQQTFGRLLAVRGKLYAASSDFVGLGLQRGPVPDPMRVVELDPITLQEKRAVSVPLERYRNATGLVEGGRGLLVLGTEGGGVFLIDPTGPELTIRRVGKSCVGTSSIAVLREGTVLMICADQLLALSTSSDGLTKIADLPPGSSFLVTGPNGDAYTTAQGDIWQTSAALVDAGAKLADRTVGGGAVVSSESATGYVTANVETLGQSAWIAKAPITMSNDGGAWVGYDFGVNRQVAAAEVTINWVSPFNTPTNIALEGSNDGRSWTRVGTRPVTAAPSAAPYWSQTSSFNPRRLAFRFWRITPTSGLRDSLAVEFLEFRLRDRSPNVREADEPAGPAPAPQVAAVAPPTAPVTPTPAAAPQAAIPAVVPAPVVDRAIANGSVIGSSELGVYKFANVTNSAQTAWSAAETVANSYNGGAWIGYDFGAGRGVDPQEVALTWVAPFNTPTRFAIEASNDGRQWSRLSEFDAAPPNSAGIYWSQTVAINPRKQRFRYWRLTPVSGLRDSFAVEFLQFRRR